MSQPEEVHVAEDASGEEDFADLMDEQPVFEILMQEQETDRERLCHLERKSSRLPLERRTRDKLTQISTEVEELWKCLSERIVKLGECKEYKSVEELMKGWVTEDEVRKDKLLNWVKKQLVRLTTAKVIPPNPCTAKNISMRAFYLKTTNRLLDKYESTLRVVDNDEYTFGQTQIEKQFMLFVEFHELVVADNQNQVESQQLEGENKLLAERVQRYLVGPPEFPMTSNTPLISSAGSSTQLLEAIVNALSAQKSNQTGVRLPRIELPKFDGGFESWADFKERFTSMIHHNESLKSIDKMHYLKQCLEGEAKLIIDNLSLSQYEMGWAAVVARYQNKKVLVFDALKKLFSLKPVGEQSGQIKALLDSIRVIKSNLAQLGENVDQWNSIFVFIMLERLHRVSFESWEQACGDKRNVPQMAALEEFLENRVHTLTAMERRTTVHANASISVETPSGSKHPSPLTRSSSPTRAKTIPAGDSKELRSCSFCSGNHLNFMCPKFSNSPASERRRLVISQSLCLVCFGTHSVSSCSFPWRCKVCKERHNTRIHVDQASSNSCSSVNEVLLATAILRIRGNNGLEKMIRVLIDQGSMCSFISEAVVQHLALPRERDGTVVAGIGGGEIPTRGRTQISFASIYDQQTFTVKPIILPKIITTLPELNYSLPLEFNKLRLADVGYWKGGPVDGIFGADVYQEILMNEMIKGQLLAQNTHLGWILSGRAGEAKSSLSCCTAITTDELDQRMKSFWEQEEKIVAVPAWTDEQIAADNFYEETTTRAEDGRYVCRLPVRSEFSIGETKRAAVSNMFKLEKRFKRQPQLKERYVAAMGEYFELGHAVPAPSPVPNRHCALPHLAVIKEHSATTRTRVVFNASSKSSNGKSLNDNLMVGPVIQRDLCAKLLRFRSEEWVVICDIEKMYRQIKIHSNDQPLQMFVWRATEEEPLQWFYLTTVTFGQASAPFTATRTLKQLAMDCRSEFPLAANIILNDTYVDDLHFGAKTRRVLLQGCNELITVLESAGFKLRKFASNDQFIMESLPSAVVDNDELIRFMGLVWNRLNDCLSYPSHSLQTEANLTKRELLAEISSIFDPLGWVQPLVVPAKMMIQSLWKLQLKWDAPVPKEVMEQWTKIVNSLNFVDRLSLPRWTKTLSTSELHAFCDASESAYGAVVYLRTDSGIYLLAAKSRVAPLAVMTIPRLELKGAVLLAELIEKIQSALDLQQLNVFCWCDSKVTLHWIQGDQTKWKPFVRNRTAFIRERTSVNHWFYVSTKENPADMVSRGCTFDELRDSTWLQEWQQIRKDKSI